MCTDTTSYRDHRHESKLYLCNRNSDIIKAEFVSNFNEHPNNESFGLRE